ncbi:major histocompatibility complex class I-related gene protein-like isoform X2 [Polypterus senegalus]|uniref:major histocompatibility complex class I-related gene protein-like isoform X2 n=1 Tax=Polypterus senegalus TaxID=55291 RepID=UPI001965F683|nr:major histocompatibility complex class I-related gene protein-like isoform X2 [Polypterus senegalus]
MEYMYRVTLICLYCTPSSLTVLHTFRFLITEGLENSRIPKLTFSEMVGEDELYYYDSNNMTLIHRYDWLEGLEKFNNLYLLYEMIYGLPETIVKYKRRVLELLNRSNGIHIGQVIVGCEVDQEDQTDWFFSHVGFNGEDLLDVDLKELTCTILDNQADSIKEECNSEIRYHYIDVDAFREFCVLSLKEYLLFGKETLERKEIPKVSLFQTSQAPSDIKLVCHVTGFFPRDIEVTWIRNEMDQLEAENGEILPNDDKTYQVRKTIIINHADLEKYKYSCHVDHASLTKKLIIPWKSKESDLAVVVSIIIIAVVITAVLTGIVLWKKKQAGTSRHADAIISQEELNQKNICPMLLLPFAVDKTNTPEIQEEEHEQGLQPLHENL